MCGGLVKKIPYAALYDGDEFFEYNDPDYDPEIQAKPLIINVSTSFKR